MAFYSQRCIISSLSLSLIDFSFSNDSGGLDQNEICADQNHIFFQNCIFDNRIHILTFFFLYYLTCRYEKLVVIRTLTFFPSIFQPKCLRPSTDFGHQKEILQHLQELVSRCHLWKENVSVIFSLMCQFQRQHHNAHVFPCTYT